MISKNSVRTRIRRSVTSQPTGVVKAFVIAGKAEVVVQELPFIIIHKMKTQSTLDANFQPHDETEVTTKRNPTSITPDMNPIIGKAAKASNRPNRGPGSAVMRGSIGVAIMPLLAPRTMVHKVAASCQKNSKSSKPIGATRLIQMLGAVIKDKEKDPASIQKRSSFSKRHQKLLRSVTVGGHIEHMALPYELPSTRDQRKHIQRLEQTTLLNKVSIIKKTTNKKRCIKRDILDSTAQVSAKWRQTSLKEMWSYPKRNSMPQIATQPFQISSHAKAHINTQLLPCSIRSVKVEKKVKSKGKHSKRASNTKFTGLFYSRPTPPQGLIPSMFGKTAHIKQLLRARNKGAFKMSRTGNPIAGRNMATLVKKEGPPIILKEAIKLSAVAKGGYNIHADSTTSSAQCDSKWNGPPFYSPKMEVIPKQNGQTTKQDYLKRVYDKMSMDAAAAVDDIMGLGNAHRHVIKEEEDLKQSS